MDTNAKTLEVGIFGKVTLEQYLKDWVKLYGEDLLTPDQIRKMYEKIRLPKRGTSKSAGYDFTAPFGFTLKKGGNIIIPTGIRAFMDEDTFLACYPRSGMGFKYRVALANSTGIIDADYCESDNQGHIMIKLCYDGIEESSSLTKIENEEGSFMFDCVRPESSVQTDLKVNQGDKFVQGIFCTYGIVENDDTVSTRNGGLGSTGK